MKRNQIFKTVAFSSLALTASMSFAKVEFTDDKIREDIHEICEKYEEIKEAYTRLDSSSLNYVIRYGKLAKNVDGAFETDGNKLYLTFKKKGQYSLQVRFIHEATHARQFEEGRIGFVKNGMGNYVIINHPGNYSTLYGHLSRCSVKNNQRVRQGSVIGYVGKTGNASHKKIKPHVHFEVRKNGKHIDPLSVLTGFTISASR